MKTPILVTSLITGLFLSANGQQAAPAAPAAPRIAAPTAPAGQIVPGTQQRSTLPPGDFVNRPATTEQGTTTTSPNNPGTTPTTPAEGNNSQTATADAKPLNVNAALRDQAVTPSDRMLLSTLNQGVAAQLGQPSSPATPVHFLINNGAVTLVGTVPTADEGQRILSRVQQTPGVLSVFNDLRVGTPQANPQPNASFVGATADHAFSPADQSLLTGVQQAAAVQLGINSSSAAQMPVHFSIQNGVVGVMGQVSSVQEKQTLLAAIQRTPGVNRVVDNLSVINRANTGVNNSTATQNPFLNNGNLPATSRDVNQTNSFFLNTTNSSGF